MYYLRMVSATSEGIALLNMAQPICSLWNCQSDCGTILHHHIAMVSGATKPGNTFPGKLSVALDSICSSMHYGDLPDHLSHVHP